MRYYSDLLVFPGQLEATFSPDFRRNSGSVSASVISLLPSLLLYPQCTVKDLLMISFLNQHDLLINQKCSEVKFYHS